MKERKPEKKPLQPVKCVLRNESRGKSGPILLFVSSSTKSCQSIKDGRGECFYGIFSSIKKNKEVYTKLTSITSYSL